MCWWEVLGVDAVDVVSVVFRLAHGRVEVLLYTFCLLLGLFEFFEEAALLLELVAGHFLLETLHYAVFEDALNDAGELGGLAQGFGKAGGEDPGELFGGNVGGVDGLAYPFDCGG